MNRFRRGLMVFVVRLFEVAFALLAIGSIIATFWYFDETRKITTVLKGVGVLAISLIFWVFLSRIDKSSTWEVVTFKNVLRAMADAFRSIIGAVALIAAVAGIVAIGFSPFASTDFFAGLGALFSSPVLLLLAVGKKRCLYLITIPAMVAPTAINQFVFRYDYSNDETMIMLTIAAPIVIAFIVRRYYEGKKYSKMETD